MANKMKNTLLKKEYMRERNRIQRQMRKYQKIQKQKDVPVLYRYNLPNIPKKITDKSINRLQKITNQKLQNKYEKYIKQYNGLTSIEFDSKMVDKLSFKGATDTELTNEMDKFFRPINDDEDFYEYTQERDDYYYERMQDDDFANGFDEGLKTYEEIKSRIKAASIYHPKSATRLEALLEEEIAEYGFQPVMYSIGQAPTLILAECEIVLQTSEGAEGLIRDALDNIHNLIKGALPTADEKREWEDIKDSDTVFDNEWETVTKNDLPFDDDFVL